MVRILLIGATGRMGQAILRVVSEQGDLRVSGAITSDASPHLGKDAGEMAGVGSMGVRLSSDLPAALREADVAVDFSLPAATAANVSACSVARKPLLIGTTGIPAGVAGEIERAAQDIPLLVAPNTSVGVTLLLELVRQSTQALSMDFDVEIVEAHHRMKKDAPSGTALALGQAVADARGQPLGQVAAVGRHGHAPRKPGEIGYAVVRGGDIVGEHTVIFAGAGEQLVLGHRATDRAIFARGALQAARWLAGQTPGRYTMRDVIGLKSGT